MDMLNRVALIVTPKRRFLEWVNALPDPGKPLQSSELPSLRSVYLAAAGDVTPPLQELIDTYWDEIFDEALNGWTADEALWPVNRTPHVFRDWFHVECIDEVHDMDPSEPLTVQDLAKTRCAMCEADLPTDAIAVVVLANRDVRRMTIAELETQASDDSSADPHQILMVLRCCRDECAKQVEDSLMKEREAP